MHVRERTSHIGVEAQLANAQEALRDSQEALRDSQEALRDSQERYSHIVETTNEGVWIIDKEHKTTFMNRRMARMLGCEADMGVGRTPFDFMHVDDRHRFTSYLAERVPQQDEVRYSRTDGTSIWTLLEAAPLLDSAGGYNGSLAMVMDITERRQAEAALRTSEARFRRLWDSGIILLTICDVAGSITEINDAGLLMLGYSRAEFLEGRIGWQDLTPGEWHETDRARRIELQSTGIAAPWEKELIRKDGSRVSILTAAAIVEGIESIAIAVDLTGRKRAEKDLVERMKIAALTADVGMVLTHDDTLDAMLSECSAAIVQHLDLASAKIWTLEPRTRMLELQASAGPPVQLEGIDDRIPVGHLMVGRIAEQRRPHLTNDVLYAPAAADAALVAITAFGGHPLLVNDQLVGVLAIMSSKPISAAAFAGLGAISDALAVGIKRKLVTRTNAALESQLRQSQKMEAVGRLAGGIAHDFNNILTVILTCGEFLLEDLKPLDPVRADVEEICKAGKRAAALTRQLLMFSRQQVLEPKVVDLAALTANMDSMLRRVLGEDVDLVLLNDEQPGRVRVDPGSIEQLIMNLVVNARDAMPTGGVLTIETRTETTVETVPTHDQLSPKPGRHVVLSVSDTGEGMDQATQARVFEPFFTTKGVGQGTGLGLSTVFGIVEQSNGTICLKSELGRGTTFTVYLPHVEAEADAPVKQSRDALRGTETIMLVEDEEQVRAVTRAILERHGYRVLEMRTAGEALTFSETSRELIHLLLTDVVMPQMSGPDLARRLIYLRPGLRVLCMSGYTDDRIVKHGVLQAEIAFLQKPFTSESLTRKVREVLDLA